MLMERQSIRSIRKGSVQWSEEDRLELVTLLAKCGYAVRIKRKPVDGSEGRAKRPMEYLVEYWEESDAVHEN
jgi:hypothetical protein